MVMPRSRSRSPESITRSATCSLSRKVPLCLSMPSTSVVLPWSTCATMAMLRRSERDMEACPFSTQKANGLLQRLQILSPYRFSHRVKALVHVNGGSGDPAGERAQKKGRRDADLAGAHHLGQGRVCRAVGDHLVDDADGGSCTRAERAGRDGVDPHAVFTAGFDGTGAGVAFEHCLRRRHASAIARHDPL